MKPAIVIFLIATLFSGCATTSNKDVITDYRTANGSIIKFTIKKKDLSLTDDEVKKLAEPYISSYLATNRF